MKKENLEQANNLLKSIATYEAIKTSLSATSSPTQNSTALMPMPPTMGVSFTTSWIDGKWKIANAFIPGMNQTDALAIINEIFSSDFNKESVSFSNKIDTQLAKYKKDFDDL